MHHHRVKVTAAPEVGEALIADLVAAGESPAGDADCILLASTRGPELWQELSARHPDAVLGVEHFDAFGSELSALVVERGTETVLSRTGVLPEEWGRCGDEDGEPLDGDLLRAAAESVEAQRMRYRPGTLSSGVETALSMGMRLGRLCDRTAPTIWDGPDPAAIEAMLELAVSALWVSCAGASRSLAELEFEHALRLTQAAAHAGCEDLADGPGRADWSEWLMIVLEGASAVVDAACHCRFEPVGELPSLAGEHHPTAEELLELEARALLTSCLQALALFDAALAA